jgi:hypothetical protein
MMTFTSGAVVLIVVGMLLIAGGENAFAESKTESGMTSQGLASEPAGIGEKGTGQTQSTLERSGGAQTKSAPGFATEPSGIGEKGTGQTQSTMERSSELQSRSSQGSTSEPSGIVEKGTGQTQGTMERSGSGPSNR